MPQIIALHGDYATPGMLKRDVGDLASLLSIMFFDAEGWKRIQEATERLLALIRSLDEPPILLGYSRGGSVIALISKMVELHAAVLYESPVVNSYGAGGYFPVLQIWNNAGAKYSRFPARRKQARLSDKIWKENHPVTQLEGVGEHFTKRPPAHCWDTNLNPQIVDWISKVF